MRVAFRVDASLAIGSGHVMRCLTLADTMREFGVQSLFLSRDHHGNLHEIVQDRGYPLLSLGGVKNLPAEQSSSTYDCWLGVDKQCDAEDTRIRLAGISVDWLVVDHYGLDADWENALRPLCGQIMAIDDLAIRKHAVELLLDQNLGKNSADYELLVSPSCKMLLGPNYALLRHEFAALRSESLARRGQGRLRKLLVTMGGVDPGNATGAVLEALNKLSISVDLEVTVVMGPYAPWREQVIQQARCLSFPTEVLVNVDCLAELMLEADLAIGAAGSTSWERCCMGLPTLQLVLADNQRSIANALSRAGAAHLLEPAELEANLLLVMDQLMADRGLLIRMSSAASTLVDGLGAKRVFQALAEGI